MDGPAMGNRPGQLWFWLSETGLGSNSCTTADRQRPIDGPFVFLAREAQKRGGPPLSASAAAVQVRYSARVAPMLPSRLDVARILPRPLPGGKRTRLIDAR